MTLESLCFNQLRNFIVYARGYKKNKIQFLSFTCLTKMYLVYSPNALKLSETLAFLFLKTTEVGKNHHATVLLTCIFFYLADCTVYFFHLF